MRCAASTTRQTRSTSSTARRAVCCMKAPSLPADVWSPGVSTKTICAPGRFLMPVIRLRVVCGRGETIASFWPTRRFRRVDLPVFGRPMSETNPARVNVAGSARPVPSVGGPRRGATRLRSAWRFSFQTSSARPVPSVGGPRRGATRQGSAWRYSFQQAHPEPRGHPAAVRHEDLPLAPVHELRLDGVPVVITNEVEHAVRDEQVELERKRHAEPARLAPGRVRGDHDLAHERTRPAGDFQREREDVGALPNATPGGVQPADLVIADDEDLDGAPGPSHRREGRARQTRRPDGDTPLTIRDRHRHQVPSAAFPVSRVRASWTSYARTIADTSRWRTTSPSSK